MLNKSPQMPMVICSEMFKAAEGFERITTSLLYDVPKHVLLLGLSDEKIEMLYGLDTSEDNVAPNISSSKPEDKY